MIVKILGCGTIIPKKSPENCSGYLIDRKILIDCGPGIWKELSKSCVSIPSLNYILISHFHADHTSDLAPILMTRWIQKDQIKQTLKICGPVGLRLWFEKLSALFEPWINKLQIELTELADEKIKISGYAVYSNLTEHTKNSLCYKIIDGKNKKLFYSGDSGFNENIVSLASECDVAIIESSNTNDAKVDGHLTPQLAGKAAQEAGVRILVLTHLYPEVYPRAALSQASEHFKGKIMLAKDGMEIEL